MTPGKTTRSQVIEKWGEPTKSFSKGGKLSDGLSYQGSQGIKGTLEVDFFFDKHGVLFRIDVFPTLKLKPEDIARVYGKEYTERVTKAGHSYYDYVKEGLVVFFDKDTLEVISFLFTTPAPSKTEGAAP
jgi:hypothetical protein